MYAYGHHRDKDSFRRSQEEGCVACNRLPFLDEDNSLLGKLGYFSVFYLDVSEDGPIMHIHCGTSWGPQCKLVPIGGNIHS
jgi:hypothetical protein